MIYISLTAAPLPDPTPTPPKTPKRTRNGAEMDPNGAKRTRNGQKPKSSSLGWDGRGVCRDGEGGGRCKGKRKSLRYPEISDRPKLSSGNQRAVSKRGGFGECTLVPTKGRFRKGVVLANVPLFRFFVPGNIRMYPRSGFWYRGTSECTLVPVFGTREHPPKPPFWKVSLCESRKRVSPSIGQGKNQNILDGTVSGTNGNLPWDKPGPVRLGQTGTRFWDKPAGCLLNSTVKLPFCPVCPWDRSRFVPGTVVPQGPSEKCLRVFCLFFPPNRTLQNRQIAPRGSL